MDIFEIHKYGHMPAPAPPETPAFEALFRRPASHVREPLPYASFWRTWLDERD